MKKFFSLFLAALFSVTMFADTKRVYCQMTQGWWTQDNAAIAAYAWKGDVKNAAWPGVRMTPVEGMAGTWYIDLDLTAYENLIFARVNGSGELADYGAQTKTLTVPADKDLFTITNTEATWGGNPGCDGEWSVYVAPKPAENVTLYFVNDDAWEKVNAYVFSGEVWLKAWPGEEATKTAEKANGKDIYSYTFPETYTKIIFNNRVGDEGPQTDDLEWNKAKPYYSLAQKQWYATAAEIPGGAVVPEKEDSITLYFVNAKSWEKVQAYVFNGEGWFKNWPGEEMKPINTKAMEKDVYAYTFPSKYTKIIFNSKVGDEGEQTSDLTWEAAKPYFYEGKWYATVGDITPRDPLANGYYLIGQQGWDLLSIDPAQIFKGNPGADGEYMLENVTLAADQEIKVVAVEADEIKTWYPDGMNNAYKVDAAHAGVKTIYFNPAGNEAWSDFGGFIYIEANSGEGVENTGAAVKATKVVRNGMLLIEKGGKVYNVLGAVIR